MRLRACLGFMLLALSGCAELPERVRVEVGDHAIELERLCREAFPDDDAPKG
jgi:hypothetical protein